MSHNPYRDVFLMASYDLEGRSMSTRIAQSVHRDDFCHRYAWAIPDDIFGEAIAVFAQRRLLEVGAGTGYWGMFLHKEFGIDVVCTDIAPYENHYCKAQWFTVQALSAVESVQRWPDRTLLMVWPEWNTDTAFQTLLAYTGDRFVYVGEGEGGCTADDSFFTLLDSAWDLVGIQEPEYNYMGINTRHYFYVRKAVITPLPVLVLTSGQEE